MATERVRLLCDGEELVEIEMNAPMTLTAEESLSDSRAALVEGRNRGRRAAPASERPRPTPHAVPAR
jgi:hypothetical protein